MEYKSFYELYIRVHELYREEEFAAAFDLIQQYFDRFPKNQALLYYWRLALSTRLGETAQALRWLELAQAEGIWYNETLLRNSPALKDLQNNGGFQRLVEANQRLYVADPQRSYPLLTLRSQERCKGGGPPCSLLLGLHANSSSAVETAEYWRAAASEGWLVALPESRQGVWKGAYVWDDLPEAEKGVQKHLAALLEKYRVDKERIVVGGHGVGGQVALWLALRPAMEACGFVLIAPAGPILDDLEEWTPLIQDREAGKLRGVILFGAEDRTINPVLLRALSEKLNQGGVPCQVEEIPGLGHDFSPQYAEALLRALHSVTD